MYEFVNKSLQMSFLKFNSSRKYFSNLTKLILLKKKFVKISVNITEIIQNLKLYNQKSTMMTDQEAINLI